MIRNEYWFRAAAAQYLGSTWTAASEDRRDRFVRAIGALVEESGSKAKDGRGLYYGWRKYGDVSRNGWHCDGVHLTYSRFPRA